MQGTNRRAFLAGGTVLPIAASAAANAMPQAAPAGDERLRGRVAADLDKYIGFGSKQAGGAGDNACGAWLASELEGLGFAIERLTVSVPFFDPARCDLVCGETTASVWPQPIVVPTPAQGVTGPLVRVDAAGRADAPLAGAIALVDLPFARWSSALQKGMRDPVTTAFAAGASAAVVITNGPSGDIIALNADGRKPMFAGPVALIAPRDARPFLDAATKHAPATLRLTGTGGHRPAFNFVGRIDRGKDRWVVVSTPRSGWFGCAGERGSGVAGWLWLARWASGALRDHNLAFVCNTGHEYEYLGAAESLHAIAPPPEKTHFWLHVGANFASRDWHDGVGTPMPLPSVDTQRYLAVSPELLPLARAVFAGHPGFEAPYSAKVVAAGELTEIIAGGYPLVAGLFGAHRFHHVAGDDARCVPADRVADTSAAFQEFLRRVAAG